MSLSKGLVDQLEQRLVEEREALLQGLDDNARYGLSDSMRDSISELSLVDNHPADIGDELFERSKDLALREKDSLRLHKVEQALNRVSDGTYGTCEECGSQIPFARLEVEPAADLCVKCQEQRERAVPDNNRPVEELFLHPGFGRTNLDDPLHMENVGYDGEDAWQDVARHGTSDSFSDGFSVSDPDELYIESEERISYVEDIENYLTADIYGNPTGFNRNAAYLRNPREQEDF